MPVTKKPAPKQHRVDKNSVLSLRKLRQRVAHTANIVSTTGRINERPGEIWQANMETRTIEWTPTFPLPPHDFLNDDDIMYLVAHEASHCNKSGLYDPDKLRIPKGKQARFHRFVNAIEDVRVDRLSALEFGGFRPAKEQIDLRIRDFHLAESHPEEWSLIDQIALNAIFSHDLGLEPFGSDEGKKLSAEVWPMIDRIANLDSTAAVARGIAKLFLEVDKIDEEQQAQQQPGQGQPQPGKGMPGEGQPGQGQAGDGQPGDGSGQPGDQPGDGAGEPKLQSNDPTAGKANPSQHPAQSEGKPETKPLPFGEEIKGIGEDAHGDKAKNAIKGATREMEANQQENADAAAMQGNTDVDAGGTRAGNAYRGLVTTEQEGARMWDAARDAMRQPINALANRLKATLQTNAADSWSGGHRRGRLHSSKAYRASAGNPRIFRKREAIGDIDYTFGILVDRSSSMRGKATPTLYATVLIAEALEKANLGCVIVSWNMHPVAIKPMGGSIAKHKGELGSAIGKPAGGTYEAPALLIAYDEFKRARSGHRMVFTITDGETAKINESRQLIQELRDLGVKSVSIGVGYPPASYYDEQLEVADAAELARILPRFINSIVRKGGR